MDKEPDFKKKKLGQNINSLSRVPYQRNNGIIQLIWGTGGNTDRSWRFPISVCDTILRSCLTEIYRQRVSFSAGEVICLLPHTYDIHVSCNGLAYWILNFLSDRSNMYMREEANVLLTCSVEELILIILWCDLGRALENFMCTHYRRNRWRTASC